METEIDPIKYGVLWERVQTMDYLTVIYINGQATASYVNGNFFVFCT